jgi:hypothetical protein
VLIVSSNAAPDVAEYPETGKVGDFLPGKSDVDLLVLSDSPTAGLEDAVRHAWEPSRINLDVRVVGYAVAAAPTRRFREERIHCSWYHG